MSQRAQATPRLPRRPDGTQSPDFLAPVYGMARALLGREGHWRSILAGHIAPAAHDMIVETPCGAGELSLQLSRLQPYARILAVDADAQLVARAQARLPHRSRLQFAHAAPEMIAPFLNHAPATKVILTLTDIHRLDRKAALLDMARTLIDPRGALFVIDFGAQRTALMRRLHNAVRGQRDEPATDGRDMATPLIRATGFVAVDEAFAWPTPSGAVSLFRARAS